MIRSITRQTLRLQRLALEVKRGRNCLGVDGKFSPELKSRCKILSKLQTAEKVQLELLLMPSTMSPSPEGLGFRV